MVETLVPRAGELARYALQGLGLFVTATFAFDVIHLLLHRCLRSRLRLLRRLARPHQAHHDFYDRQLRFHPEARIANLVHHVLPEYGTQMAVCAAALLVLPPPPVLGVMVFLTTIFAVVLWQGGRDGHHIAYDVLPAAHAGLFVRAAYHALHHVHPDSYLSSYTTLLDRLAGTACQIKGRRVALTGASGAFGSAFKALLEKEGAAVRGLKFGEDFTYDDYGRADDALREADILVLCHGSKKDEAMWANCESFVALIERFRALTRGRRFPVEVWAVGSEIECHPAFGDPDLQVYRESKRAFARHARRYYHDRGFLYRHIVPSAFRSRMGPGLITGATAARVALFFIRRGFRYVPVTYTGIAFVNYLKFLLRVNLTEPPPPVPAALQRPSLGPRPSPAV